MRKAAPSTLQPPAPLDYVCITSCVIRPVWSPDMHLHYHKVTNSWVTGYEHPLGVWGYLGRLIVFHRHHTLYSGQWTHQFKVSPGSCQCHISGAVGVYRAHTLLVAMHVLNPQALTLGRRWRDTTPIPSSALKGHHITDTSTARYPSRRQSKHSPVYIPVYLQRGVLIVTH